MNLFRKYWCNPQILKQMNPIISWLRFDSSEGRSCLAGSKIQKIKVQENDLRIWQMHQYFLKKNYIYLPSKIFRPFDGPKTWESLLTLSDMVSDSDRARSSAFMWKFNYVCICLLALKGFWRKYVVVCTKRKS